MAAALAGILSTNPIAFAHQRILIPLESNNPILVNITNSPTIRYETLPDFDVTNYGYYIHSPAILWSKPTTATTKSSSRYVSSNQDKK